MVVYVASYLSLLGIEPPVGWLSAPIVVHFATLRIGEIVSNYLLQHVWDVDVDLVPSNIDNNCRTV